MQIRQPFAFKAFPSKSYSDKKPEQPEHSLLSESKTRGSEQGRHFSLSPLEASFYPHA